MWRFASTPALSAQAVEKLCEYPRLALLVSIYQIWSRLSQLMPLNDYGIVAAHEHCVFRHDRQSVVGEREGAESASTFR